MEVNSRYRISINQSINQYAENWRFLLVHGIVGKTLPPLGGSRYAPGQPVLV